MSTKNSVPSSIEKRQKKEERKQSPRAPNLETFFYKMISTKLDSVSSKLADFRGVKAAVIKIISSKG